MAYQVGERTTRSVAVDYYLEKGDYYSSMGHNSLQKVIADDEVLLKKALSEKFRDNDIIDLIKEYNVRSFKSVPREAYQNTGSVGFYVRIKGQPNSDVELEVNDTLSYKLPDDYVLMVQLPVEHPSKVCFTLDSAKVCDVLSASPFVIPYYELKVDAKDLTLEIKPRTEKDAQNYIRFLHETNDN